MARLPQVKVDSLCVFTKNGLSALQFVRVFPSAEAVDEVTQLIHMLNLSGHYHLFTDQVGLRQVRSSLQPELHCHMLAKLYQLIN